MQGGVMGGQPLPRSVRDRIVYGSIAMGALVLLTLPLEIVAVTSGRAGPGEIAGLFAIGVGLPLVFGLLLWWMVRRIRRDPELRRRQLNSAATRVILAGNFGALLLGNLARGASGVGGGGGWAIGLGVTLLVSCIVVLVAKRFDPRIRFFRRPEPVPEDPEPEEATARPW